MKEIGGKIILRLTLDYMRELCRTKDQTILSDEGDEF